MVHLAAIASVGAAREDPERAFTVNLGGTLNIAAAVTAHAPGCRLLFFGSGDCYGSRFRTNSTVTEDEPLAPLNSYAASKAAADLALGARAAETGLRVIRLRPFNQVGANMPESYALGSFAAQIKRIRDHDARPVLRVGNLDAERDFLHVRDVAEAAAAALARFDSLPNGEIYNIASGIPQKIGAVLVDMIARSGLTINIDPDPARMRPSDIPRSAGNAAIARSALGWTPNISYADWIVDVLGYAPS